MHGVEMGERYCNVCARFDEQGKVTGGTFCVQLSGISGTKEIFTKPLSSGASVKFVSRQRREPVTACRMVQACQRVSEGVKILR